MMMEKIKGHMNNNNNKRAVAGDMSTQGGGENDFDAGGTFDMPPPPTVQLQPKNNNNNNPYSAVYEHSVSIHHRHSPADHKAFVEYRGEMYAKAVDDGNVPPFIQRWLEYCQGGSARGGEYSDDDYEYLGGLLRGAPVEPPSWVEALLNRRAAAAAAAAGGGGGKQKVQRINTVTAAEE